MSLIIFICSFILESIHPSIHPSLHPSIHPSIHSFIHSLISGYLGNNFCFVYSKFSSLTCFDQYLAVAKCVNVLRDQKAKQPKMFGLVSPTPTLNQLEFLYDLFELSGDVHGLLDFVAYLLMPSEEDISTTQVALVKTVVGTLPTKSTIVVAMLRKYHACLMLLPEHTTRIFRG